MLPLPRCYRALKRTSSAALVTLLICQMMTLPAWANPQGGSVVAGDAQIQQRSPSRLDVIQGSQRAIIDWRSFSIGAGEHTHFDQPSASAVVLNRVPNGDVSRIFGTLTANGKVILVNPRGIHFGASSNVDVAGMLATTADIANDDFMAGKLNFAIPGNPDARILNEGTITARNGGLVALVAPWVENRGAIHATLGRATLASGDTFTLDLYGDGLIELAVSDDTAQRLVGTASNTGLIEADGGVVSMLAADAANAVDNVINLDGVALARSFAQIDGRIALLGGDTSAVTVAGTLDASGSHGGAIDVAGGDLHLTSTARLDASGDSGGGNIRVGGELQGGPGLLAAQRVRIDAGAELLADARESGDGGTIIAWSDGTMDYEGALSARGAAGGSGGFAEISGLQGLRYRGTAQLGAGGRLLLDPHDMVVGVGLDATIGVDAIRRQMIAGTTVELVTTDDLTVTSTIDGRVSTGGTSGGGLVLHSLTGNVFIDADIITHDGAIGVEALQQVVMSPTLGGLSGDGVALVVTDGAGALGNAPISITSGGTADLQYLATLGDVSVDAGGQAILNRDLGTLNNPLGSLSVQGNGVTLPANVITANGNISVMSTGALQMAQHMLVSDGSGTAAAGVGDVFLSFGSGDLDLGDLETRGLIDVDFTGSAGGKVTISEALGGSGSPIGGLDIDAPDVDQRAEIVALGDVRLGRVAGDVTLRRDIFTGGGDFESRGHTIIDPRRPLLDAMGNPIMVTKVFGITDAGELIYGFDPMTGAPIVDPTHLEPALGVQDLADYRYRLIQGQGDFTMTPFTAAEQFVLNLAQDKPAIAALIPNLYQASETANTFNGNIGKIVTTTWTLTIDTIGALGSGDVNFNGTVGPPDMWGGAISLSQAPFQSTGHLPPGITGEVFSSPAFTDPFDGTPVSAKFFAHGDGWVAGPVFPGPTNGWDAGAQGTFERVELAINAGTGNIDFGGELASIQRSIQGISYDALHLNIESAGGLSFNADPLLNNRLNSLRIPDTLVALPLTFPTTGFPRVDTSQTGYYRLITGGFMIPDTFQLVQDSSGLSLVDATSSVPNAVVVLTIPSALNPKPTTSTIASSTNPGASGTGSAGGYMFTGGGTGLFGGTTTLPGAPGAPPTLLGAGPETGITFALEQSLGESHATGEEDPVETTEEQFADGRDCPTTAPSAYQATPGDAAFAGDPRGNPYSVDAFCGSYDLVDTQDPRGEHYGDLTFATRDFWTDAEQARSPLPIEAVNVAAPPPTEEKR